MIVPGLRGIGRSSKPAEGYDKNAGCRHAPAKSDLSGIMDHPVSIAESGRGENQ